MRWKAGWIVKSLLVGGEVGRKNKADTSRSLDFFLFVCERCGCGLLKLSPAGVSGSRSTVVD